MGHAFYIKGIQLKEHTQVPNKEDVISVVGSMIDTRADRTETQTKGQY
jgi:hypothetical protein